MRNGGFAGLVVALACVLACGGGSSTLDGSVGAPSSPVPDAGGFSTDAAAPPSNDAGHRDAAAAPPGLGIVVPCTSTMGQVYVTPSGMPAFTPATRGDVVRCGRDVDVSLAQVGAALVAKGLVTTATTGVSLYRVAYRTTRGNGAPGVSAARVYVPTTPRALPLPVIVVGHPTEGLASSCAPSKDPSALQDLALPWASQGFAVIAPDYAGLGNDDIVQGYVDNHDTAYSTLDATRAMRKLFAPTSFTNDVLAVGYSQGGGAVLSAQALEKSYGAGGKLVGVVAFAPEWPTRDNSFGYKDLLEHPADLTITKGVSSPTVAAMRQYAYFSAYAGKSDAALAFPAAARAGVESAINGMCQTPFGGYLQATFPKVGDLFEPAFHDALLACMNGAPGCVEPAKSYHAFLRANVLTGDPTGAPVLFVQGIADTIMPAASEAACNLEKLHADGVVPQVCTDLTAVHTNVVSRNMDFALSWGQAILQGKAPPVCPETRGMPPCSP